jgi:predicted SprT family Zn-dependent metalloprotease
MDVKKIAAHELMHLQFMRLRKGEAIYHSKDFKRFVEELSTLIGDDHTQLETCAVDGTSVIFRKKGDTTDTIYTPQVTKREKWIADDYVLNRAIVK